MAKRAFDLILAALGLVALWPIMLAIVAWIRADSSGPALFRQTRVGRGGRLFKILKFRTMVVDAEAAGPKITGSRDKRVTRSGQFLRKTKLDELPQLINVLKGDMSLVGPRPEVPEYVAYYPDEARREILSVRPGMTDLASIEFSDEGALMASAEDHTKAYVELILPRKLELQRRYVQTQSLLGDLGLIVKTVAKLLAREEAKGSASAT